MEHQDAARMFENLLGNLPGMVYRCKFDPEYTMLYSSEGCQGLTGYPVNTLIHNKQLAFKDLILEADQAKVWQSVSRAVEEKGRFEVTYRIKTKDGSIKWVWDKGNGIFNHETKELEFLEGFITDITGQKEVSMELADRESRLREILKNVKAGVIFSERQGVVLEVNEAAERITGIPSGELIGKKPVHLAKKFIKPKELPQILGLVLRAICGQEIPPYRVSFNRKIIEVTTSISGSNSLTVFLDDITRQKEFEDQIIQSKIKAEESDRLKSTFLANMSHEIRTPMNGIVGFTELLRDPDLTQAEKLRYIDIIHANSEQLLNIINDILDVSRIEAGRLGIFLSRFDPYPLLTDLQDTAKILVKHKPITVTLKYDLPIGATIETDKNRLQQILFNLVANASKFTHTGFIELGCHRINADFIEFFIKDSGIGIRKEAGQKIFERFRQVEEGDNRPFGGTGLGLSISKSLVQLLGGKIGYVSTHNKGSQFYFTLPDQLKSFK